MGQGVRKAAEACARERIAPLFHGCQETLIRSALEGCMGNVWTVDTPAPAAALCDCADFLFVAGDEKEARALLAAWKAEHVGEFRILTAATPALHAVGGEIFANDAAPSLRCAFAKGDEAFDRAALQSYAATLPQNVCLRPFDRDLYALAMSAEWSRDFCSQFRNADDFLLRGLGVAALHGDSLVGGASSYTVYGGGIEIQIQTREDHFRQGIATACGAKLILECLSRGLYPSWDAANPASQTLAEKLGYRGAKKYPVWELYPSSKRE